MDREIHDEGNVWSTAQRTERSMVRTMCGSQLKGQRDLWREQCVEYSSKDNKIHGENNVWITAQWTERSMVRTMCGLQLNGQRDPL